MIINSVINPQRTQDDSILNTSACVCVLIYMARLKNKDYKKKYVHVSRRSEIKLKNRETRRLPRILRRDGAMNKEHLRDRNNMQIFVSWFFKTALRISVRNQPTEISFLTPPYFVVYIRLAENTRELSCNQVYLLIVSRGAVIRVGDKSYVLRTTSYFRREARLSGSLARRFLPLRRDGRRTT